MSERNSNVTVLRLRASQRDRGMTLPELLIAVTMIGLIITVLAATVIVTMKQQGGTSGRLTVAHAEQTVGLWIPADLASADDVTTDPWASPCNATVCSGIDLSTGSNVLMLTWTVDGVTTNVSYHFRPQGGGLYELIRVQCVGSSCASQPMLRDLPGPPSGQPFVPGVGTGATVCQQRDALPAYDPARPACTRPSWVINVSAPLAADAVGESPIADPADRKDANRVIVTINGGGASEGAGGGVNQISITAGGTTRREIDANSLLGAPSLVAARSRCGGLITLIVDESTSIGQTNLTLVKDAVRGFVDALIGTPVKVQIVQFDTISDVQGSNSTDWHKYYDMTSTTDVSTLKSNINNLTSNGRTNWEDAWYRTFYDPENGATPARVTSMLPETVVFFTDGVPNESRLTNKNGWSTQDPLPNLSDLVGPQWGPTGGSGLHPLAFNRAEYIASLFRTDVNLIGVGVGAFDPDDEDNAYSNWPTGPGVAYRDAWQVRATWTYQRRSNWTWETNGDYEVAPVYSTVNFQKANLFQVRKDRDYEAQLDYEKLTGSTWGDILPAEYYPNASNTTSYRIRTVSGVQQTRSWYNITALEWFSYRSNSLANFRDNGAVTATYETVTEAQYDTYNTTTSASDESDKWRVNPSTTYTNVTPTAYDVGVRPSTARASKFRISTTPRTQYAVTPTEYATLRTLYPSPGAWTIGSWSNTDAATYAANNVTADANDGYRIGTTLRSWTTITSAQYDLLNTTNDSTDFVRKSNPSGSWQTTTQADFALHEVTAGNSDGYQKTNPTGAWVTTTEAEYDFYQDGTNTEKSGYQVIHDTTGVTTPDGYDVPTVRRRNDVILTEMITGEGPDENGDPGEPSLDPDPTTGEYDLERVQEAKMFFPENWTKFPAALKAIALGECAGTLTMQTRLTSDGSAVGDPFTYQNTWFELAGTPREPSVLSVTTNLGSVASPFDFSIPGGQYVDVGVELQNFDELGLYAFDHWECKSAGLPRNTAPYFAQTGGTAQWPGMSVRIAANEAVSCIQWVRSL